MQAQDQLKSSQQKSMQAQDQLKSSQQKSMQAQDQLKSSQQKSMQVIHRVEDQAAEEHAGAVGNALACQWCVSPPMCASKCTT